MNRAAALPRTNGTTMTKTMILPAEFDSWKSYTLHLVAGQHPAAQDHYTEMFGKFIGWHQAHCHEIFDSADPALEGKKKVASWRRMARAVLNNDLHGKGLSFGPTRKSMAIERAVLACDAALAI